MSFVGLTHFAYYNPAPVIKIGNAGNVLDFNEATLDYFKGIAIGDSWREYSKLAGEINLDDIIGKDSLLQEELRLEGSYLLLQYRGIKELNAIQIYAIDITEMKRAEYEKKKFQAEMTKRAYSEGLAESAISVLHNIGNILTSIIGKLNAGGSVEMLNSCGSTLGKIVNKMEALKTQEDVVNFFIKENKLAQLTNIIREISFQLERSGEEILFERDFIKEKSYHIGNVISTQQQYASLKSKLKSNFHFYHVLDDCLFLHQDSIEKNKIILLKDKSEECDNVKMEKIGLSQTISNMIVNSIEAISSRRKTDPSFSEEGYIKITTKDQHGHLTVIFEDNGCGIEHKDLKNLFKFGFSTKERGSGFGLHSCSNFMKSNGGSINISSKGVNFGTKVILTIPLN